MDLPQELLDLLNGPQMNDIFAELNPAELNPVPVPNWSDDALWLGMPSPPPPPPNWADDEAWLAMPLSPYPVLDSVPPPPGFQALYRGDPIDPACLPAAEDEWEVMELPYEDPEGMAALLADVEVDPLLVDLQEGDLDDMAALLADVEADPFLIEPAAEELQEGGGHLDQAMGAADPPVPLVPGGAAPHLGLPAHFNILEDGQQHFPHFNYTSRRLVVLSHGPPELFLREVLDLLLAQCDENDRVALSVTSECDLTRSCHMPFRPPSQLSIDLLTTRVEEMIQSGSLDQRFWESPIRLTFHKVTLPPPAVAPQGQGRPAKRGMKPISVFAKDKRSIVQISNTDTLCLARALAVALAYKERDLHPGDDALKNKANNLGSKVDMQRRAAVDLMWGAGVTELECPTALKKFQTFLNRYRIIVVEEKGGKPCVVYDGQPEDAEDRLPRLYLLFADNHFDVIIKINAAFGFAFFCESCMKGFDRVGVHKCSAYCKGCFVSPPCQRPPVLLKCQDCSRLFNGPECLARHKECTAAGNSTCSQVFICKGCLKSVDRRSRAKDNPHACGELYCRSCGKYMPAAHLCYMQPLVSEHSADPVQVGPAPKRMKGSRKEKNVVFVFYDLECVQTTPNTVVGGYTHTPILCVTQKVCLLCVDKEVDRCDTCGEREQIFRGTQCIKQLIDYVQTFYRFENIYCLAHNARSYDGQFVLKHMIEVEKWNPEVLEAGTKLMCIRHFEGKLVFMDSLNFIPLPLSGFSKAFGLGEVNLKGDFPHFLLNVVDTGFDALQFPRTNYISPTLPPVAAYGADLKGEKERSAFLAWHEAHLHDGFDYAQDLVNYCRQDVSILRRGCLVYRKIFLENAQFDPFRSALTIASTCLKIFRTLFLPKIPNQIAVLPAGNRYRLKDQQSKSACTYLAWIEHQLGRNLESVFHGREKRINRMKVDGFDSVSNTIYEYHGCFYHCCCKCFPSRDSPFYGDPTVTYAMRYEATLRKTATLRALGFTVVEMWECDFQKESRDNAELQEFLVSYRVDEKFVPLDPREAFFGGRTEAIQLYHRAEEGEKMLYKDFTSLYPYCNKYGKYAIGHPRIFLGDDPAIPASEDWEGLVKCAILPPRGLHLPLLPYRLDGKLFFPLCHTCVTERKDEACCHPDEARVLHGTWVTDEIKKALQLGYRLVRVHELWQYKVTQYDPRTRSGGLFAEYVNTFLRLKQEASGWPDWAITEDDKSRYLDEYLAKEGISLNRTNIKFNPGLRQIAKLALNSFWGKFGQRPDLTKTEIVKEADRFFQLLSDPNIDVYSCTPVSDTLMVVKWGFSASVDVMQPAANVIVAAYTTCNARLKLYSVLEQLGDRVLYLDTDSVIYRCLPGEQVLPTGDYLGELTDELAGYGAGAYISEFASGGPKNYGYRVTVPGSTRTHESFKVKGIRLNHANSAIVNLDRLKDMLGVDTDEPLEAVSVTDPYNIRRLRDHTVVSKPQSKIYRVVFDKRRRVGLFDSLPWGY